MSQSTEEKRIFMLHLDCLEHIIKYLTPRDQLNFRQTSTECKRIIDMLGHSIFCKINLSELQDLTMQQLIEYLVVTGPYVLRVVGSLQNDHQEILKLISEYCPNIKRFACELTVLKLSNINNMLLKLSALVELQLVSCWLRDRVILMLTDLKYLRTLVVSNNFELTGKYMNGLTKGLDKLWLNGCTGMCNKHIAAITKALINLRELNLEQCFDITTEVFRNMLLYCKKIENLKISPVNDVEYELIAELPKLSQLTLYKPHADRSFIRRQIYVLLSSKTCHTEQLNIIGKNCITDEDAALISQITSLRKIVCPYNSLLSHYGCFHLKNLTNLVEIVLTCCRNINNNAIQLLISSCLQLNLIHVQSCLALTTDLVFDVLQDLQLLMSSHKVPVIIMAKNSRICESVIWDPRYVAGKHLLKMDFKSEPSDLHIYQNLFDMYDYESIV